MLKKNTSKKKKDSNKSKDKKRQNEEKRRWSKKEKKGSKEKDKPVKTQNKPKKRKKGRKQGKTNENDEKNNKPVRMGWNSKFPTKLFSFSKESFLQSIDKILIGNDSSSSGFIYSTCGSIKETFIACSLF